MAFGTIYTYINKTSTMGKDMRSRKKARKNNSKDNTLILYNI